PKSSRSKPTSRSSFMYAALVAVGIKRCMPCIASRGHSVIDTLAAPLPCACDRGTSTIVLIDLHGKWQPCLDTPQLQRRFCLLIIAVVHTELALAEPRAYPVGRATEQRFERTFDGRIGHHPVGFQACLSGGRSNRIVYA